MLKMLQNMVLQVFGDFNPELIDVNIVYQLLQEIHLLKL